MIIEHSDACDHRKSPCTRPTIRPPPTPTWGHVTVPHPPTRAHPSPCPLQLSKYSRIASTVSVCACAAESRFVTSMPCLRTWSEYFSASFHSRGVPIDNSPISQSRSCRMYQMQPGLSPFDCPPHFEVPEKPESRGARIEPRAGATEQIFAIFVLPYWGVCFILCPRTNGQRGMSR